jgi:hypothetical protein
MLSLTLCRGTSIRQRRRDERRRCRNAYPGADGDGLVIEGDRDARDDRRGNRKRRQRLQDANAAHERERLRIGATAIS